MENPLCCLIMPTKSRLSIRICQSIEQRSTRPFITNFPLSQPLCDTFELFIASIGLVPGRICFFRSNTQHQFSWKMNGQWCVAGRSIMYSSIKICIARRYTGVPLKIKYQILNKLGTYRIIFPMPKYIDNNFLKNCNQLTRKAAV